MAQRARVPRDRLSGPHTAPRHARVARTRPRRWPRATFAGGRINATLKYVLAVTKGWRAVADNFLLRIVGEGVTHDAELHRLVAENVLVDAEVWRKVAALLPEYRLSKFQPALPDAYAVDVVAGYLLDGPGTRAWLGGALASG